MKDEANCEQAEGEFRKVTISSLDLRQKHDRIDIITLRKRLSIQEKILDALLDTLNMKVAWIKMAGRETPLTLEKKNMKAFLKKMGEKP